MTGTNTVRLAAMLSTYEPQRTGPHRHQTRPIGLRILLADNSPMFCHALGSALMRQTPASAVEIVTSLADLEPALQQFRPSLVLLDLSLGRPMNVSGRQVLENIVRQSRAPKVIVLTEDPAPQMISYVMAAGAFAQFDKALETEALIRAINQMVRFEGA